MARIHYTTYRGKDISTKIIDGINQMVDSDYERIKKGMMGERIHPFREEKLENRFSLPKELFETVNFTDMGVVKEDETCIPKFVKGEKYALSGMSCEGFEMPEKVYELVAVHDKYDDININSVIVKQISGDRDKIFTLSKNDCAHIGIEYENGLQLFPNHLNWRRLKDTVPFNACDLSTTPLSDIDNTVRYVVIKLYGFKDYHDGYILSPSGKLVKEEQFTESLRITSNEPFIHGIKEDENNKVVTKENTPLKISIVYPNGLVYNHGNFISCDDTIYVKVDLTTTIKHFNHAPLTKDFKYGVEKETLIGFNPNNHFNISWDEMGCYTVEEYEEEKARKEKERQERIAKEEANRQKRVAEEEKRIKEQRKKVAETIGDISKFNVKLPPIPKMNNFNMESGISSLSLYADGLDAYFDILDSSLEKLSFNLDKMTKTLNINTRNGNIAKVNIVDFLNI